MRVNLRLHILLFLSVLFYYGCAAYNMNQRVADFQRPAEYERFFELLDRTVDETGVRDASGYMVSGFPYLRTNRFLTGLKNDLNNDARKDQWIRWLQQLDLKARQKEIQNLPTDALEDIGRQLGVPSGRHLLQERTAFYSEKLLNHDQRRPEYYKTVLEAVTNPDEYSTSLRVVGLYPLTSLPFAFFILRSQDEFRKWHNIPADQPATLGELTAYGPSQSTEYSAQIVRLILKRSRRNALNVPIPSIADGKMLLTIFAPVIYQDVAEDYDKIGEVIWQGSHVGINPQQPTVYYYFSHARFKGGPVLQLNYVFWYSARNGPNSPWIERGLLDGMTVRISLDDAGRPFMVDIMNNCGCYHFFVPDHKTFRRVIPSPFEVDVFVPRRLPVSFPVERLTLRTNSGWHQVDHMDTEMTPTEFLSYRLVSYDHLEALPRENYSHESIFNSRGIAKGSGRIEPLIFFPMGIPDVGSMRQRGHHAVKLVGRSYFSDPDLFDHNFEFE